MRRHQSASVLVPALRTVGNIVTGDDLQVGLHTLYIMALDFVTRQLFMKAACWSQVSKA